LGFREGLENKDVVSIDSKYGVANDLFLILPNSVKIELVDIPEGNFEMGSFEHTNEKPVHSVTLSAFKMSKYPITQKQFHAVIGNVSTREFDDFPVEHIAWDKAVKFCEKLSKQFKQKIKLPSEAQWEYACRSGSTSKYYFGDNVHRLDDYAWYSENSENKIHKVGIKKPNEWGVYDMYGNVWEWCEDVYKNNYNDVPNNGTAWTNGGSESITHVMRGGSAKTTSDRCYSSYRRKFGRLVADEFNGFRIVVLSS